MRARLGHAVYWMFVVLAVLVAYVFIWQGGIPPELAITLAAIIYGVGYAARYVLTGRKRPW